VADLTDFVKDRIGRYSSDNKDIQHVKLSFDCNGRIPSDDKMPLNEFLDIEELRRDFLEMRQHRYKKRRSTLTHLQASPEYRRLSN